VRKLVVCQRARCVPGKGLRSEEDQRDQQAGCLAGEVFCPPYVCQHLDLSLQEASLDTLEVDRQLGKEVGRVEVRLWGTLVTSLHSRNVLVTSWPSMMRPQLLSRQAGDVCLACAVSSMTQTLQA
jgi:hypothetical protein